MLEASIAVPLLLFFILAAVDALRLGYAYSAARYAVNEAANWASKGETIVGVRDNKQVLKSRVVEVGLKSGIEINPDNVLVCSFRHGTCEPAEDIMPGELFLIKVNQPFKFITLIGYGSGLKTESNGKASNT